MALYFVRSSDLFKFETFADALGVADDVHLLADDAPIQPSNNPEAVAVLINAADTPSDKMLQLETEEAVSLIKADDDELASIRRKFGC